MYPGNTGRKAGMRPRWDHTTNQLHLGVISHTQATFERQEEASDLRRTLHGHGENRRNSTQTVTCDEPEKAVYSDGS